MDEGIVTSPHPRLSIPENISLIQYVSQNWEAYAERIAIIDLGDGKTYTYRELAQAIHQVALGLSAHGVAKGQTVLMCCPNSADFIVFLLASLSTGATVTLASALFTAWEIHKQMLDSGSSYLFTSTTLVPKVKKAAKGVKAIKEVFVTKDVPGCVSIRSLMSEARGQDDVIRVDVDPKKDVALIPYSSGTTGAPKGVLLTHFNVLAACTIFMNPPLFGRRRDHGHHIVITPFSHSYAALLYLGMLTSGDEVITMPRFDFETYLRAIDKYKVERLWIVPPIAVLLAKDPRVENYDLSSVKDIFCGAAPLGHEVEEQVTKRLPGHPEWRQGYGMSENSGTTHIIHPGFQLPGSVGFPVNNTECKVVDEHGKSLAPYMRGELLVRGPQIMIGYLNNPQATSNALDRDGWLHTGDIAYYNERGAFYVVDRLKELIKYKGYQVAPAELEALLLSHPGIADVCVIGLKDLEAGEVPRAYVIRKQGQSPVTERQVMNFVAEKVAPYKKLRGGVCFVRQIPKSSSGKILRRVLRDSANEEKQRSMI